MSKLAMLKVAVGLFAMLIATMEVGASPPGERSKTDKQERAFADSMAKAMSAKKYDVVYANMSPKVRERFDAVSNVSSLNKIHGIYGDILKTRYKSTTHGTATVSGTVSDTVLLVAIYWYAVETSLFPTGRFMKLQVSRENGRYFLASYEVLQFMGEIPPFLK